MILRQRGDRFLKFSLQKLDLRDVRGGGLCDGRDIAVARGVVVLSLRQCSAERTRRRIAEDEELSGFRDYDQASQVVGVLLVEQVEARLKFGDFIAPGGEARVGIIDIFAPSCSLRNLTFHAAK